MFNLQGSEIIFILLIALVVLGPEKLPGAIKRVTQLYAEFRKMSSGFQAEFKAVVDEPVREMRETADLVRNAADPKKIAEEAEKAAEAEAAERKAERAAAKEAQKAQDAKEASTADDTDEPAQLGATSLTPVTDAPEPVDEWADPVDVTDRPGGAAREDIDDHEVTAPAEEVELGTVDDAEGAAASVDDASNDELREESA